MSLHKILNEDWSDYDNKKKKSSDRNFVSCEKSWERQYIKEKIKKHYSQFSDLDILAAITHCCVVVHAPRPRERFVALVFKRLGIAFY